MQIPGAIRQLDFSQFVVSKMLEADTIADVERPSVLTECLPHRIRCEKLFARAVVLRRKLLLACFVI